MGGDCQGRPRLCTLLRAMTPEADNMAMQTFPARTEGSVKKHWYKDMHYAEFAEDEVGPADGNPLPSPRFQVLRESC